MSIRVLIADDHEIIRCGLRCLIEDQPDIEVVGEAENGRQATELVEHCKTDVVIMDIGMPNMNGYEATREIRKKGITTPIVALTANAMKGDDEKCIEASCDDYLAKPIDHGELLKTIAKYLPSKKLALIDIGVDKNMNTL